jgi:hypothetical protein
MPVAGPVIGAVGGIASSVLGKKKSGGTATQTNAPPSYLQPYLSAGANQAQQAYNSGGPQVYGGSAVAPLSDITQGALGAIANRASSGSSLVGGAQNFVQQGLSRAIDSGFGTPTSAGSAFNPYARSVGAGSAFNPYAQSVGGGASGNPYADTANPYGAGQNPHLDAAFGKAAQSTQNQLSSEFARSGRDISATLPSRTDQLNGLASQIYMPAYEAERNRAAGFDSQKLGIGASGFENAQSRSQNAALQGQQIGAQAFGDYQNRGFQDRQAGQQIGANAFNDYQNRGFNAGENAQNRSLQDVSQQRSLQQGLLGSVLPLANQDYTDLGQLANVGGVYDNQNQAQLTDQVNRFNQQQAQPGQNLDDYIRRITGMAGNYGTQTSTQPAAQPNYLGSALGGAMLGGQLGGMFGSNNLDPYQITGAAANGGYRP